MDTISAVEGDSVLWRDTISFVEDTHHYRRCHHYCWGKTDIEGILDLPGSSYSFYDNIISLAWLLYLLLFGSNNSEILVSRVQYFSIMLEDWSKFKESLKRYQTFLCCSKIWLFIISLKLSLKNIYMSNPLHWKYQYMQFTNTIQVWIYPYNEVDNGLISTGN